jgi:hypothetical protein
MDSQDSQDVDMSQPPAQQARQRSTSPLAFPTSSTAHPSSDPNGAPQPRGLQQLRAGSTQSESTRVRAPGHEADATLLDPDASSSPLAFPSSSASQDRARGARLFAAALPSSGLSAPEPNRSQRRDSPLFFPG